MNIMIDYDHTFTADKILWMRFMRDAKYGRNHKVYVVTSRDSRDILEDAGWFEAEMFPIIYCDYRAKRQVCEEKGIDIHIWVDDKPYFIDHGYEEYEAAKWRSK